MLDEATVHLYDTQHFGQSICHALENRKFSNDAFPGRTQVDRTRVQKNFAKNLTARMNAEFQIAYQLYGEDLDTLKNKVSHAVEAVMACFNGNCGDICEEYSLVCSGTEGMGTWNHEYLDLMDKDSTVCFLLEDLEQIRSIVNDRLGREGVEAHSTSFEGVLFPPYKR